MPRGIKKASTSSDVLFQQLKDAIKAEVMAELVASLTGSAPKAVTSTTTEKPAKKGKRKMSPEARAKIAEAARKRWAKVKAGK